MVFMTVAAIAVSETGEARDSRTPQVGAAALRFCRRVGLKGVVAMIGGGLVAWMVPWCVYLAVTLPTTALAANWSIAWVGFDVALAAVAAATAWFAHRGDLRAGLTALAAAVMLVMDGWFDTMTAGAGAGSLGLALGLNLPLAAGAAWYSRRVLRGHLRLAGAAGQADVEPAAHACACDCAHAHA